MSTGRVRDFGDYRNHVLTLLKPEPKLNQKFPQDAGDIPFSIRGKYQAFYHVISDKCRQRFHAKELVCFMERQVHTVNNQRREELIFSVKVTIGAFQVSESIYFSVLYRAAGTGIFDGSLRVRPSLVYRVPGPSVNTDHQYIFFSPSTARPSTSPGISARSPHQPREVCTCFVTS